MPKIVLPNNWKPRPYQRPLWKYLESGGDRAVAVWHRRAGKDDVLLHRTAVAAHERVAPYWHLLPEYKQARKAVWAAVNPHTGRRRIDEAFPQELRESTNEQEMFIRFKVGSTWQLVGADRYNSLVGAGVAGVAFSEFALSNPASWAYIKPMLEENNGWAAFISTPRGNNHLKRMMDSARENKRWFAESLSIHDTGALSQDKLDEILGEYIDLYGEDLGRATYEQEYEVSFTAAILGAFYAREMVRVRREGRIVPDLDAVEGMPVHTAWDIGTRDDTSIWFFQVVGVQIFILDCYSASGAGVDHYADVLKKKYEQYGWTRGVDFVPHDAKVQEWGTGRTRVETMIADHGLNPRVCHMAKKQDGINAVRKTLPRCVFHDRCEEVGIPALENYRREWDPDKKAFREAEVHDWACHLADAFRYLSLSWEEARKVEPEDERHKLLIPKSVTEIYAPPLQVAKRRR